MNSIIKLPETLKETLVESDLSSIVIDGAEITIDQFLSNGIIKEIPIINTLVSIVKGTQSVGNYLFLKKMVSFLNEVKDIPIEKRRCVIQKIEESKKYRNKVGEQLLFILDHCEDNIKAENIAYWFKAFINQQINYSEFLQGASAINKITTEDFYAFITENVEFFYDNSIYIGAGLTFMSMEDVSVENIESGDWDENPKLQVFGGELEVELTNIGHKIREVFKKKTI